MKLYETDRLGGEETANPPKPTTSKPHQIPSSPTTKPHQIPIPSSTVDPEPSYYIDPISDPPAYVPPNYDEKYFYEGAGLRKQAKRLSRKRSKGLCGNDVVVVIVIDVVVYLFMLLLLMLLFIIAIIIDVVVVVVYCYCY